MTEVENDKLTGTIVGIALALENLGKVDLSKKARSLIREKRIIAGFMPDIGNPVTKEAENLIGLIERHFGLSEVRESICEKVRSLFDVADAECGVFTRNLTLKKGFRFRKSDFLSHDERTVNRFVEELIIRQFEFFESGAEEGSQEKMNFGLLFRFRSFS